jgi:hypothetical protein
VAEGGGFCHQLYMLHIYENPNSRPGIDNLSTMDLMIDPEGEDLPEARLNEKVIHHLVAMTCVQQARNAIEPQDTKAAVWEGYCATQRKPCLSLEKCVYKYTTHNGSSDLCGE